MTVEAVTQNLISELVTTNPADDDYIAEGADHLRLIKSVLKGTFTHSTAPCNTDTAYLDKLPTYFGLGTTTNPAGGTVNSIDLQGAILVGAGDPVSQGGITTVSHVDAALVDLLKKVYPVGTYYITESSQRPEAILGFGNWNQITGFIVGEGSVSTPNIGNQSFTVSSTPTTGINGGALGVKLTESQMPQQTVSASSFSIGTTGSTGGSFVTGKFHAVGNGDDGELWGDPGKANPPTDIHVQVSGFGPHTHTFSGSATLGHDASTIAAVPTLPPFHVAKVWRRDS